LEKPKQIFLFLLCAIAFYYSISLLLFKVKIGKTLLIQNYFPNIPEKPSLLKRTFDGLEREKTIDMLFLGSSHCYRAFDPKVFEDCGYNIFNLGSSSQTPINSYFLLQKSIHKTNAVVLEVYPVTICNSGNESYLEMVGAINCYTDLLQQAFSSQSFFDFQLLSLKPFIDNKIKNGKADYCIFRKGYAVVPDSAINRKVIYDTLTLDTTLMKFQLKFINKIVALCKEKNKKLIFTYAPLPSKLYLKNEAILMHYLKNIINKNSIPFIDMSHKHHLNDGYNFYDDDHMNASGVVLYNKAFIDEMKNRNLVK